MNTGSIAIFAVFGLMLLAAVGCVIADARDSRDPALSSAEQALARFVGFFGIGGLPLMLAAAVLLSTAAIAGATLEIIAHLHLGRAYPAWFPANAALTGLGVGLGCTRLLAGSRPPGAEAREPGTPPGPTES